MSLTLKDISEIVQSTDNINRVKDDKARFDAYNGKIRELIKRSIQNEFQKPETVTELINRIVTINISQPIVNKRAGVYREPALRTPVDMNDADQDLIDLYSGSLRSDQKMKMANRYFKLHKHSSLEPYLDRDGIPRMRILTSQNYTPISDDPVEPERPTHFVKHLFTDTNDVKKRRFSVWSDDEFFIINGEGEVVMDEMRAVDNVEGVNPFGKIPFTYIPDSDDGNLIPISDDDLLRMQIIIPLLLTDVAFASKYNLWSVIALIGAQGTEELTFNPSSIVDLPAGADVKVLKPEVDSDKALRLVEALLSMLLSSQNLSIGDISTSTKINDASGVSKLLDRAETTEDRSDQEAFFENAEKSFWDNWAHNQLPVLVEQGKVNPEFVGRFSDDFELAIQFADPKPFVGDKEKVELEIKKLESGLTTKKRAIQIIDPSLKSDQADDLLDEIGKEQKEEMQIVNVSETEV